MKVKKPLQRDMELVRQILLAIQSHPGEYLPRQPLISDWSDEQVSAHLRLLIERGYVEAEARGVYIETGRPAWQAIRMRWEGYDFLAAARDDTIWEKAKHILGKAFNDTALDVLKALLIKLALEGLP